MSLTTPLQAVTPVYYPHDVSSTLGAPSPGQIPTLFRNSAWIHFLVDDFIPLLGLVGDAGDGVVLCFDFFSVLALPLAHYGGVIPRGALSN